VALAVVADERSVPRGVAVHATRGDEDTIDGREIVLLLGPCAPAERARRRSDDEDHGRCTGRDAVCSRELARGSAHGKGE
jgi:hypothetical protein